MIGLLRASDPDASRLPIDAESVEFEASMVSNWFSRANASVVWVRATTRRLLISVTCCSSMSFPPAATILFWDLKVLSARSAVRACCPNSFRRSCSQAVAARLASNFFCAAGAKADFDHAAETKPNGRQSVVKCDN